MCGLIIHTQTITEGELWGYRMVLLRSESSGMLHGVEWQIVTDVSKRSSCPTPANISQTRAHYLNSEYGGNRTLNRW
jgi:hypothetical protein